MSKTPPARSDRRPPAPASFPAPAALRRAEVLGVADEDTVLVRLHRATPEEVLRAEIALSSYSPVAGDRVLVAESPDGWFVLGVLGAARRRQPVALPPDLIATSNGASGVELRAARGDLTLSAAGRVVVRAASEVTVTADAVRTTARVIADSAGRRETDAERIVERTANAYRQVSDLLQTTAGRARTMVDGDHDMSAARTTITPDGDTSMDGERVLLG